MITLIAKDPDLREGFLVKDAKFETRNEKDIADRDSCARSDHRTTACVAGAHPFAFDGAKCSMHVCLSLDYPRLRLQRCAPSTAPTCPAQTPWRDAARNSASSTFNFSAS